MLRGRARAFLRARKRKNDKALHERQSDSRADATSADRASTREAVGDRTKVRCPPLHDALTLLRRDPLHCGEGRPTCGASRCTAAKAAPPAARPAALRRRPPHLRREPLHCGEARRTCGATRCTAARAAAPAARPAARRRRPPHLRRDPLHGGESRRTCSATRCTAAKAAAPAARAVAPRREPLHCGGGRHAIELSRGNRLGSNRACAVRSERGFRPSQCLEKAGNVPIQPLRLCGGESE